MWIENQSVNSAFALARQGTGQCPTHFSQATSETRFFRRITDLFPVPPPIFSCNSTTYTIKVKGFRKYSSAFSGSLFEKQCIVSDLFHKSPNKSSTNHRKLQKNTLGRVLVSSIPPWFYISSYVRDA